MRPGVRLVAALATAAAVLAGCETGRAGADRYQVTAEAPTAREAEQCSAAPGVAPGQAGPADWTTYHRGGDRRGVASDSPPAGRLKPLWGVRLDGEVFTQPLVYQGLLVVATQHASVYAFDAGTGCLAWRVSLGEAVDASGQPCANVVTSSISRELGVTSTPVIDPATLTVYVVSYLVPGIFEMVALDLASGLPRWRRPVELPGADLPAQLNRPALALANGRVYAAFGGRAGSCGSWHGYVVAVRADGEGPQETFQSAGSRGGSIWAPGGPVVLPGGDLLVTTGEGASTSELDGGNSVVRLSPSLERLDSFSPVNWAELTRTDFDLGSVGPTLVGADRAFQVGKQGIGYLVDLRRMGGVGGQVYSAQLEGKCYAIGATAYLAPLVYVPCDHGLKAVRVEESRFQVAWTGPDFRSGSPVVAGGVVWSIDFEGGYLWSFDPRTGEVKEKARIGVAEHFVSPAASAGRVYVPAGRRLLAFTFAA